MSSQGAGASGYLRQARAEIFLVPGGAYPGKELPKWRQPGRVEPEDGCNHAAMDGVNVVVSG